MVKKKKIAIACQGGGSHTAFTVSVLKKWFKQGIQHTYDIVGLSGTSGGAICAAGIWYGLLKEAQGCTEAVYKPLEEFWEDNQVQNYWEQCANFWFIESMRLHDAGLIPSYATSPYNAEWLTNLGAFFAPRKEFYDLKRLVEKHIDFDKASNLIGLKSPRLILGAVDVLNGDFKAFDSKNETINVHSVLASACIPRLFKAVEIEKNYYWDGLFSQNPPLSNFIKDTVVDDRPDEIRIIQVNPTKRDTLPNTSESIIDRRNELAGNLSLFQEINFINQVNEWIEKKAFKDEVLKKLKPIEIRFYTMSTEFANTLDYASKLDRSQISVERLYAEGQVRG